MDKHATVLKYMQYCNRACRFVFTWISLLTYKVLH